MASGKKGRLRVTIVEDTGEEVEGSEGNGDSGRGDLKQ